jgi:hypothetical protein
MEKFNEKLKKAQEKVQTRDFSALSKAKELLTKLLEEEREVKPL